MSDVFPPFSLFSFIFFLSITQILAPCTYIIITILCCRKLWIALGYCWQSRPNRTIQLHCHFIVFIQVIKGCASSNILDNYRINVQDVYAKLARTWNSSEFHLFRSDLGFCLKDLFFPVSGLFEITHLDMISLFCLLGKWGHQTKKSKPQNQKAPEVMKGQAFGWIVINVKLYN